MPEERDPTTKPFAIIINPTFTESGDAVEEFFKHLESTLGSATDNPSVNLGAKEVVPEEVIDCLRQKVSDLTKPIESTEETGDRPKT